MPKLLLTCDYMNPEVIPIWEQTWDILKKKHPEMRVTVFCVPLWRGRSNNDIFKNKDFKTWFRKRKGWIEVAQHGYEHNNPPECMRFYKPQKALIKRGYRKIRKYMDSDIYTFKAPQYQMDSNTRKILKNLGFSSYIMHDCICILTMPKGPIPLYKFIQTTITLNDRNPDDIQTIKDKLDSHLTNMEKEGYTYSLVRELVRETTTNGGNEKCLKNNNKNKKK